VWQNIAWTSRTAWEYPSILEESTRSFLYIILFCEESNESKYIGHTDIVEELPGTPTIPWGPRAPGPPLKPVKPAGPGEPAGPGGPTDPGGPTPPGPPAGPTATHNHWLHSLITYTVIAGRLSLLIYESLFVKYDSNTNKHTHTHTKAHTQARC